MAVRFMKQVITWLDLNKPHEADLFDYIQELKAKRRWASTFRDALQLIRDLREGNVDMLYEMFPHTKPSTQVVDQTAERLAEAIAKLSRDMAGSSPSATRRALASPAPIPVLSSGNGNSDEDNSGLISVKKSNNNDAGANFLASLGALQ